MSHSKTSIGRPSVVGVPLAPSAKQIRKNLKPIKVQDRSSRGTRVVELRTYHRTAMNIARRKAVLRKKSFSRISLIVVCFILSLATSAIELPGIHEMECSYTDYIYLAEPEVPLAEEPPNVSDYIESFEFEPPPERGFMTLRHEISTSHVSFLPYIEEELHIYPETLTGFTSLMFGDDYEYYNDYTDYEDIYYVYEPVVEYIPEIEYVPTFVASPPVIPSTIVIPYGEGYKERLGLFELTFYCLCVRCCGIWSWEHSRNINNPYFVQSTASGTTPTIGRTIAVDPNIIPMGTEVYISGFGWRIAEDTGGVIRGNKIDIFVGTHEEALRLGRRRNVEVFIMQ